MKKRFFLSSGRKIFKRPLIILPILFLCVLFGFTLSADAATVTWTDGGADNLASNPDNWSGNIVPQDGDDVVFNSTSTKYCTWDINVILASLTLDSGYTGAVTLNLDLTVTGNVIISGGTLYQNNKNFKIGFGAAEVPPYPPSGLSATAISSTQIDLLWTDNSDNETGFKIERKTGAGGTYAQIADVGVDVTSYPDTDLIAGTTYYYRVKAYNSVGDSAYSNEANATTIASPITLTITSPLDGDTIYRPDVMVRGTVSNSTGSETGVVINGIVAMVYTGEFIVNHVPLEEGQNTIAVNAVDTDGNTATTSITVNAVTTTPYVTLRANITSGIAPLTTYFSVSTSIPNAVSSYDFDYEGDAVVDYTGATFEDISFTYTTEGVYYPTITVIDSQSITYTDSIAIVVLNATELDALLRGIWEAMTNSLSIKDTATALTYISSGTKASYEEMFNALIDQLPSIVATQTEFNLISIKDDVAKYELVTLEKRKTYSYEVTFIKDENGIWMVQDF